MKPFILKTYRMHSEVLDRDVEITVFSSGAQKATRPLIIMHDGQNLFFDKFATYGKAWRLLDFLGKEDFPDCVLAGVTCAEGKSRLDEYSPFVFDAPVQRITGNDALPGGQGDAYLEFVYATLIPHIQKEHGCRGKVHIGGSSMGGVISLYAALKYPAETDSAFCLSNAFWTASQSMLESIEQFDGALPKLYLDQGERESSDEKEMALIMLSEKKVEAALRRKKPKNMRCEIIAKGIHSEVAWRMRIEEILRWILN
jgi:predicted alpha/beta superfamily hydrolase